MGCERQDTTGPYSEEKVLAGIHKAIQNGSVLGQSAVGSIDTVFKCNDKIALKTKPGKLDTTELTGLQYVTANFPDVPAPKPLGLISHGGRWYLFTSYVPGVSLNKIWLTLNEKQKRHISAALDGILEKLRRRSIPPGTALGGVSGEGCRDARRHTRVSQNPIFNTADFIDWLLSNPRHGDAIFFEVIRRVWHAQGSSSIVFTHGDLQPFNIMVEDRGDGYHRVTGLIDWDRSGFYPDWHECFKATNNLSWRESENDWALFLPSCISLEKYYSLWCLDRMGEHYIL